MKGPFYLQAFVPLLLCIFVILGAVYLWEDIHDAISFPELAELNGVRGWDLQEYSNYFARLAKDKGGLYAYDVLRKAHIPSTTDIHEVAHGIGYALYAEKGLSGMGDCTQEFRNACSHALVIQAFLEYGNGALPEIIRACSSAPGGPYAYSTCMHGVGHGILAFLEYDYEKTLGECRAVRDMVSDSDWRGTPEDIWRKCVEGATMELDQGAHDAVAWERAKANYFPEDDILMPCNAPYVDSTVKPMCYSYITWRFLEKAGAVRDMPSPEAYRNAMQYCLLIPEEEAGNRGGCFAGFGKNFIYMVSEDERKIASLPDSALEELNSWCSLAGNEKNKHPCILAVLTGLFLNGISTENTAIRFCAAETDISLLRSCYVHLISSARFVYTDAARFSAFCAKVPAELKARCIATPVHGP